MVVLSGRPNLEGRSLLRGEVSFYSHPLGKLVMTNILYKRRECILRQEAMLSGCETPGADVWSVAYFS